MLTYLTHLMQNRQHQKAILRQLVPDVLARLEIPHFCALSGLYVLAALHSVLAVLAVFGVHAVLEWSERDTFLYECSVRAVYRVRPVRAV